ncbi:MAG: hypothetical protein WAO95_12780 [Burkholderiales bacterium]
MKLGLAILVIFILAAGGWVASSGVPFESVSTLTRSVENMLERPGPCVEARTGAKADPVPGLEVNVLSMTSDCKLIVSGNYNGSIQVFDRATGKVLGEAGGHPYPVRSLEVTSDGRYAISSAPASPVKVWTMPDLRLVATIDTGAPGENALLVDAKNEFLFTGDHRGVQAWDLRSAEQRKHLAPGDAAHAVTASGGVRALALSPDAKYIADGSAMLRLWTYRQEGGSGVHLTLVSERKTAEGARTVGFSKDGKLLVSGGRGRTMQVWKVPSLEPTPQSASWDLETHEGRIYVKPASGHSGASKPAFRVHENSVSQVYQQWTGEHRRLGAWRGHVLAYGLNSGLAVRDTVKQSPTPDFLIPASKERAYRFAHIPSRGALAVQRRDYSVSVIDLATFKETRKLRLADEFVKMLATTDGRYLAFSSSDAIGFVDLDSWNVRKFERPPLVAQEMQVINLSIANSLEGDGLIAMIGFDAVSIRPDLTMQRLATLPMDSYEVLTAVPHQANYIAVGMNAAVAFDRVGSTKPVAVAKVHDPLRPGEWIHQHDGGKSCQVSDSSVACVRMPAPSGIASRSSDGNGEIFVTGGNSKEVTLFDAKTLEPRNRLEGHIGEIYYVKITGERIVSADVLGEIRVWSISDGKLLARGRP